MGLVTLVAMARFLGSGPPASLLVRALPCTHRAQATVHTGGAYCRLPGLGCLLSAGACGWKAKNESSQNVTSTRSHTPKVPIQDTFTVTTSVGRESDILRILIFGLSLAGPNISSSILSFFSPPPRHRASRIASKYQSVPMHSFTFLI